MGGRAYPVEVGEELVLLHGQKVVRAGAQPAAGIPVEQLKDEGRGGWLELLLCHADHLWASAHKDGSAARHTGAGWARARGRCVCVWCAWGKMSVWVCCVRG